MFTYLKKNIPLRYKITILLFFYKFKTLNKFSLKIPKQPCSRIFIFLAADYGNLGDVAITYAQHKFLQQNFPDFLVSEIPISNTLQGIALLKKTINNNDIITTVGGGNMGNLYPMIELNRQMVIKNFPKNKIISFPQTIDFNDSPSGKKALKRAIRVYSKHKNLILLAREQKSFDFFKTHFKKNKILLVPDIVLTLNKTKPLKERSGAVICLRNDKEKNLSSEEEMKLLKIIDTHFEKNKRRDTHIGGENLSLLKRVKALHDIWDDFKSAELVITDRLHGMIFCYITGTPVLVFLNNNHKVKSSYHWIKTAPHVRLIDEFSIDNIQLSINELKCISNEIVLKNMLPHYDEIIKTVAS